jgi:hypothetical protein
MHIVPAGVVTPMPIARRPRVSSRRVNAWTVLGTIGAIPSLGKSGGAMAPVIGVYSGPDSVPASARMRP